MNYLLPYSQQPFQRSRTQTPQNGQQSHATPLLTIPSKLVAHHCGLILEDEKLITPLELTNLLNDIVHELDNLNKLQRNISLFEVVGILTHVNSPTLIAVAQHKFFRLLQKPFIRFIYQWQRNSFLPDNEIYVFRNTIRLLRIISHSGTTNKLCPSWLLHTSALKSISDCLIHIATSDSFFDEKNHREFKYFTRLIDIYIHYQSQLNNNDSSNKDILIQLVDSIIHCLMSHHYIQLLKHLVKSNKKSIKINEKFFLIRCPSFLTFYKGSRLEQLMNKLLPTMLPQYIKLFDDIIPSINQWSIPAIRAVHHLLEIVNHGSTNSKILAAHLPFIDHVLTIADTQVFINEFDETLSKPQAIVVHNALSLLASVVNEPTILSHIKQKKVTPSLLRLSYIRYEPLVYNIYTVLAYTTTEEDIKSMHNPGILLKTVNKSLRTVMKQQPRNESQIEQLLETLKGLVQHDQLKEEVLKQDALPFLLDCTNKLLGNSLKLLVEAVWSLSFSQEAAVQLRSNTQFIEKIQAIAKDTGDEAMKKATDGLVWKLVKEPAFLEKIAKKEEEEGDTTEHTIQTTEVIIGEDGKPQVVTTTRRASQPAERTFQYDMMISYCHADQELIRKIHEFLLDQGFKIWIDLNNMFGPAMNAMAEAVENSEFVLICMSDSYKQSTYCQAEAEYAFGCKRRLLPLIVRPGYRADGWLGFMMGSRIYIDFGAFDFPVACDKLLNEISLQRKRPLPSKAAQTIQQKKLDATPEVIEKVEKAEKVEKVEEVEVEKKIEKSSKPSGTLPAVYLTRNSGFSFRQKPIEQWVESDVLDFLFNHQLNEIMPMCERMDGASLTQLYKMCTVHSNKTFSLLSAELLMTHDIMLPIGVYTRFLSVMNRIIPPPPPTTIVQQAPPPPPITIVQQAPPPPPTTIVQQAPPPPPITIVQQAPPPPPPPPSPPAILPPPPPSVLILPPTPPPLRPVILPQIVDDPPIQADYSPYDIVVTSDASVLKVLEIAEGLGSEVRKMDAGLRRKPIYV